MPAYAPPTETGDIPETTIDAARRILAHPTKQTFRKGKSGATVRAIKVFLKWKGYDPGPINNRWDSQTQKAFTECRKKHGDGETRATPAVIAKISSDFGAPGPRPLKAEKAAMQPMMPGKITGGGDMSLRDALSGMPPASGVGPQPGMPDTEEAMAAAQRADREVGDLTTPEPQPGGRNRGIGFGPGAGATDPYQQGFGEPEPLTPSNEDYIPPMPPGEAIAGPGGDPGAEATGQLDFDPSALQAPPEAPPPSPPVMPSPAEGGMAFGPGNAAQDPYQRGFGEADPMAATGGPPPLPPGQDPALLGRRPSGPEISPMPPEPPVEGGLTGEDLIPPDQGAGSPMPQALGGIPDASTSGDIGALSPQPPSPDDIAAMSPDSSDMVGNLGDLSPAVRAPDQTSRGLPPAMARGQGMPPGAGMPGDLAGTIPPDVGDLTGGLPGEAPLPPEPAGGDHIRVIKKGDTLWDIAEEEYGDPRLWPIIAKANPGIKNPNLIYYGKKLTIPAI